MRIGQYHNLCVSVTEGENVKIGIDGNDGVIEREMSKRERDEKEDEAGNEKRMKINGELDFIEILESLRKMKGNLKKVKEFLHSEYEKKCPVEERSGGETHLHYAAFLGHVDATNALLGNGAEVNAVDDCILTALHVAAEKGHADVAKVLLQNGADVNAVTGYKWAAIHHAAHYRHVRCTLQLLCFGDKIEIDEDADKWKDNTKLLRPIENRLTLLRDGKPMGTSLMSKMERRFMWNLGFVLAVKHRSIAYRTYRRICSFVTYHGIFIGHGDSQGEGSIWNKLVGDEDSE